MDKPNEMKGLQRDLARKYELHGPKIEKIWRSLGKCRREKVMRAGAARGEVLTSPIDRSIGDVYKCIPDWNLRDITNPNSGDLLNHLKHRATKSLCDQYVEGPNGDPGDTEVIHRSIQFLGLQHVDPFRDSLTNFATEDRYGWSFKATDRSALENYLHLYRGEPRFLVHAVNDWYFSRPELVPDEKGRMQPVATDKYISISCFETLHNAIVGAAIWGYIYSLLQTLMEEPNHRSCRSVVLQELTNVCNFEYWRAQELFKRYVQMKSGGKQFKRIYSVYDDGFALVTMKIKPDTFTRTDPQLHYILRLCQPDMNVSRAVE
ncbi:hypothetical protein ETB97_005641 [Aspergillus alliaceus]|uniref:Uncharacterized protein n=1 Tax=Petromyces alliaceus TaxID=209559 RepID=A0A8H5ZYG2_PETAA|nr:hypothetical protein ETB97_005641 [Aspergillus burnettii]